MLEQSQQGAQPRSLAAVRASDLAGVPEELATKVRTRRSDVLYGCFAYLGVAVLTAIVIPFMLRRESRGNVPSAPISEAIGPFGYAALVAGVIAWWYRRRATQRLLAEVAEHERRHQDAQHARDAERSRLEADAAEREPVRRGALMDLVHGVQGGQVALASSDAEPGLPELVRPLLAPGADRGGTAAALQVREQEVLLFAMAAALVGVREAGYTLDARTRGTTSGSFSGGTGMIGGVSDSGLLGALGGFDGHLSLDSQGSINGELRHREEVARLDEGRLVCTDVRLVFLGARHTQEIPLDQIIEVRATRTELLIGYPGRRRGERFALPDADVTGDLLLAIRDRVRQATRRDGGPGPLPRPHPDQAPPAVSAGPREERDCPWCAEPILARARVCKHCGRDVEPLRPEYPSSG